MEGERREEERRGAERRREEERRGQAGRMAIAQGMAELEARRGQVERLLARQCEEDKSLEIRSLRSRLRELESLVAVMDPGEGRRREEEDSEALELERNLALLTAQYEKAGDEEEELGREGQHSFSPHPVPPAMEQLNNSARYNLVSAKYDNPSGFKLWV